MVKEKSALIGACFWLKFGTNREENENRGQKKHSKQKSRYHPHTNLKVNMNHNILQLLLKFQRE